MVALRKPNGRVRAYVVGDVFRRLVGRVLAQHFAPHLQEACLPFQYGLSTRSGTEAVSRLLRAAAEADPRATILSVDAVGAFDHVSRQAMLGALAANPALQPLLPYARQFYAEPSSYTWYDDVGVAHEVLQAEGGEQGDPLMPALHSLAQHPALADTQALLSEGEPCLRSWTTSTSSPPLSVSSVSGLSLLPFKLLCGSTPAYSCTPAKPGFGTQQARNPQTSPTSSAIRRILSGLGLVPPRRPARVQRPGLAPGA